MGDGKEWRNSPMLNVQTYGFLYVGKDGIKANIPFGNEPGLSLHKDRVNITCKKIRVLRGI